MSSGLTSAAVHLVPITPAAAWAVLAGGHLPRGELDWHEEYPLTETYDALGMAVRTHDALGWRGKTLPRWWMFQIVLDEVVVGDIGFHSPPAEGPGRMDGSGCRGESGPLGGCGVVEIGYDVVPALRGRGIATRACGLILDRAWCDGATEVIAETALGHRASQRVLTKVGFRATGPGTYSISRPPNSPAEVSLPAEVSSTAELSSTADADPDASTGEVRAAGTRAVAEARAGEPA